MTPASSPPVIIQSSPSPRLRGEITVPGDKSMSHRAILLAAIANGVSEITGLLESEDCFGTLQAFHAMGVRSEQQSDQRLLMRGVGRQGLTRPAQALDCGNSGTSMRLLAGLLAAQKFDSQLIGDASLSQRPMERIQRPLLLMGAKLETTAGKAPLVIRGGQALQGIRYEIPQASAQVKSGILLAGLYAAGSTTVVEPEPTRDHTELMLRTFGYPVEQRGGEMSLCGQGQCQGTSVTIPGDLSSAAFFVVAACLIPGAELVIKGVGVNPTRTGVLDLLSRMGACVELQNKRCFGHEPVADLLIRSAPLQGIEIPPALIPSAIDEFPILLIAAAHAKGRTVLRGAQELRVKESDRIAAMAEGLTKLGIDVETFPDGISVEGGQLQGGVVDSHQDHRIAMAFTIAGLVAKQPVVVQDCAAIATSFPSFISLARQLKLGVATSN